MMRSRKSRIGAVLVVTLIISLLSACRPAEPLATSTAEPPVPASPTATASATARSEPTRTLPPPPTRQPETDTDNAGGSSDADSLCDEMRSEVFAEGLVASAQGILDDLPGATVYEINLQISNDLLSLDGHQIVCYTNREGESLEDVYFRLFPNLLGGTMTVSTLQVDGADVEPIYELADSALRVPLAPELEPGNEVILEMDFEVDVAKEMERNYGLFGSFDGVLSLHEAYPVIPVYDDEGWNVELPPREGDITYYDASFYKVEVDMPADPVLVASGVEIAHELSGDRQVRAFVAGPARGFYAAAGEAYTVVSGTVGETTVNSYAPAKRKAGAELALKVATAALESYNERFGDYPYTEFDLVSTPMLALGMEYPGIVAITSQVYDLDSTIRGVPASAMMEGTVGHEVAHQWFYNVVGNDQIDEPWLDEALAQYTTGLYYLDAYGQPGYQGWRGSWYERWDRGDRAEIPVGLPVAGYDDGAYGAIVYGRGPFFVEALAQEMGQETFDAFLRDYYRSHAWGIGTGEAFSSLAEQHCQCDLTDLFAEWVCAADDPACLGEESE